MADIPLNYFKRKFYTLSQTPSALYTAPFDRAAILLACYATNTTSQDVTITIGFSGVGAQFVPALPYYDYAKNVLVAGSDTTNMTPSKFVLNQYDCLIASCSVPDSIILNIGLLETINTVV